MASMNFSDSQPPQPYPVSVRIRWVLGRALKWIWRSFLILVALTSVAWTLTLAVGCRKLDRALEAVNSDPTLSYVVPESWDRPAPGENAAPTFSAAIALIAYGYGEQAEAIERVVGGAWHMMTEEDRKQLRIWLGRQKAAFELASEGAAKPWCRYERKWWADQGRRQETEPWSIPIPELEGISHLSNALVALAHSRAAEGKHREARDAIRVALAVADSVRDDPFIQSQRRRAGKIASILESVTELVPATTTAADLEEWLKIIPNPEAFDGCLERAARWELKERVDLFSSSPARYWFWQRIHYRWGPQTFFKSLRKRLADPLFKLSAAKCLDETVRMVEIWRKPYLEGKQEAKQFEKRLESWKNETLHPTAPLVWHAGPSHYLEIVQEARAGCAMVKTGLEWELIRARTGSYPKTCEAIDPLTGRPFQLEVGPARLTGSNINGHQPMVESTGQIWVRWEARPNTWVLRK